MTALIKSFCGCYTGPDATRGGFLEKSPLAAGGRKGKYFFGTGRVSINQVLPKLHFDTIIKS
jgi:hypothetical protein